MGLYVSFAILCVFIYYVYLYLTSSYNYWKDRNVPHLKPKLFFGNLYEFVLRKNNIGQLYKDVYDKFPNERLIGLYKFRVPDLMIKHPDDIKRVLISDFQHFQDRIDFSNEDGEPLSAHLFNVKSDKWKPMRQKITPTFTTGKLKNMIPLILEIGEEFSKYLRDVVEKEKETECQELMAKFTTDVIGSVGFGIQMNSMQDVNAPFRIAGRKVFQITPKKFMIIMMRTISSRLYKLLNLHVLDKEIEKFFFDVVNEIVEERKKNQNVRNDFIDLMLELRKKERENDDNVVKMDNNFLCAQSFIFFAAGFETSSTLMGFVLYELAFHQDIQQKVYDEICSVLKKCEGKLCYEIISEMQYLEMVVCETQRRYPALGNLTRICTTPYKFPDTGVSIEKGTSISVPVYALHHDPKYYPEPEKFIPERFTSEEKQRRHPMTFLPFGDGPRNCIGLRLGKIQSIIGLITLLKDYRVEPCSKTESKIKMNPSSLVTSSINGVWLTVERRNKLCLLDTSL